MVTHGPVVVALGASDCEAWRPGLLHQPVNALSSLAFAAAGVWVAIRAGAGRADRTDTTDRIQADRVGGMVYAGALIANGVGSFLYHGPGRPGSAFVHDAAIPAAVLFIAAEDVALLRHWTSRRRLRAYALALGTACLAVAAAPGAGVAVMAVTAALAAAAEAALVARGDPEVPVVPVAIMLGAAVLAALAGRTGSPLCRPDSPLQPHALWHVLAAAALLGWDRARRARRARMPGRARPS